MCWHFYWRGVLCWWQRLDRFEPGPISRVGLHNGSPSWDVLCRHKVRYQSAHLAGCDDATSQERERCIIFNPRDGHCHQFKHQGQRQHSNDVCGRRLLGQLHLDHTCILGRAAPTHIGLSRILQQSDIQASHRNRTVPIQSSALEWIRHFQFRLWRTRAKIMGWHWHAPGPSVYEVVWLLGEHNLSSVRWCANSFSIIGSYGTWWRHPNNSKIFKTYSNNSKTFQTYMYMIVYVGYCRIIYNVIIRYITLCNII